jgi:hypothetical protein
VWRLALEQQADGANSVVVTIMLLHGATEAAKAPAGEVMLPAFGTGSEPGWLVGMPSSYALAHERAAVPGPADCTEGAQAIAGHGVSRPSTIGAESLEIWAPARGSGDDATAAAAPTIEWRQ